MPLMSHVGVDSHWNPPSTCEGEGNAPKVGWKFSQQVILNQGKLWILDMTQKSHLHLGTKRNSKSIIQRRKVITYVQLKNVSYPHHLSNQLYTAQFLHTNALQKEWMNQYKYKKQKLFHLQANRDQAYTRKRRTQKKLKEERNHKTSK